MAKKPTTLESITVGDTILDGKVIIASVSNDLVVQVIFPSITDVFGRPLTITYSPGVTLEALLVLAQMILDNPPF